MPSAFLVNAAVLFGGVVAFVVAGFAGTFFSRLQPWRYKLMLVPLGFVVAGGIGISAHAHLLRWWHNGHFHHTLAAGLFQTVVLLLVGSAGSLAGLGLGSSLDRRFPDPPAYGISKYWDRQNAIAESRPAGVTIAEVSPLAKVVPISDGRRQPGVLPKVRGISHLD